MSSRAKPRIFKRLCSSHGFLKLMEFSEDLWYCLEEEAWYQLLPPGPQWESTVLQRGNISMRGDANSVAGSYGSRAAR